MIGILEQRRSTGGTGPTMEANTFIGGVAASIPDAQTLATKLGISVDNIPYFSVDGENIEAEILVNYAIPVDAFRDDRNIKYFRDEGMVTGVKANAFWFTTVEQLEVPKATYIEDFVFYDCNFINFIFGPLVTSLGSTNGNDGVFNGVDSTKLEIVVGASLETNNAGNPDGDITYILGRASSNSVVYYSPNTTKPEPITDLAVERTYLTGVKVSFTPPTSDNGLKHYDVYINGAYNSGGYTGDVFAVELEENTEYEIQVAARDIYLNKSLSNKLTFTTSSVAQMPADELFAYFGLEDTTGDVLDTSGNLNHGTNFGSTRGIAGKVGNGFSLDGNDYIDLSALNSKWNSTDWSVGVWFKTTQGTAFRLLQNRGGGALGNKTGWQISQANNADWGNTVVDDGTGNYVNFPDVPYTEKDNVWHLAILTFKSSLGRVRFYIDTELKSEKTNTDLIGKNLNSESVLAGKGNHNAQFFNGSMDEIPFAQKEWNIAEIKEIWNNGNGVTL